MTASRLDTAHATEVASPKPTATEILSARTPTGIPVLSAGGDQVELANLAEAMAKRVLSVGGQGPAKL